MGWSTGPDYPFHNSIYAYSTASTESAAYIIGGYDRGIITRYKSVSIIAEYKNNGWRKFGDLARTRYYHSSITLGEETVVLGGRVDDDKAATESGISILANIEK